jgi:hypothetical protein
MNVNSKSRANQDSAFKSFMDETLIDGGKTEYRTDDPQSHAQHGATPTNSLGSTQQIYRGVTHSFTKFYDLGAHKMMQSKLFCVNTRILDCILRDSSYGGRFYGTTGMIAKEMGMHEDDVRRRIKAMEEEEFLIRMQSENGSRWILLNPHFFCAGTQEDEDIAKRLWAKERSKRMRS